MRFAAFDIPAFGPFTDFSLTLEKSGASHDLHLIYGANEQGKSSLLRAIDNMLFGIPMRTKDNFLHQNPKLRVGATITAEDKGSLSFYRKKGNAHTLLDFESGRLDENELKTYLGPVTQSFFQSMFGLTTESLRTGATALIAGEGNLGDALFSASLGNTPIDTAIEAFQNEAESLFKPAGSKNTIVESLKAYKASVNLINEHRTTAAEWKSHTNNLRIAQDEFKEADQCLRDANAGRLKLERILAALPNITRLQRIEEQILALSHIPNVPEDFVTHVRETQKQIERIHLQIQTNERTQAELKKKRTTYTPRKDILAHSSEIESLYQILPSYLELRNQISPIEIDNAIADLPPISKHALSDYARLTEEIRTYQDQSSHLQTHISQIEEELSALTGELEQSPENELSPEFTILSERVSEQTSKRLQLAPLTLKKQVLETKISSLWQDSPIAPTSQLPSRDNAHHQIQILKELDHTRLQILEKQSEAESAILEIESQLSLLGKQSSLTSREELISSRDERDLLVANSLETGKIDSALPSAISKSDSLADSLHMHAESISQANSHQIHLEKLRTQRNRHDQNLDRVIREIAQAEDNWNNQVTAAGLKDYTPHQYLTWKETWETHLSLTEEINQLDCSIGQITKDSARLVAELQKALSRKDTDFDILRTVLQQRVNESLKASGSHEALVEQKKALTKKLREQASRLRDRETHLNTSKDELEQLTTPFPVKVSIPDIHDAQQQLTLISKVNKIQQRIRNLSEQLLEDHQSAEDAAIYELKQLLEDNKDLDTKTTLTQESLESCITEHEVATVALASVERTLSDLTQSATSQSAFSLEETLAGIEEKSRLVKEAEKLRLVISEGTSEPFAEFLQEATSQSEADWINQQHDLDLSLPHLEKERDAAREALQILEARDEELNKASSRAAEENQNAQLHLSSLTTDAKRFIQLQSAIHFLREQIELYRQRNQGPMLTLTSSLFSQLTNGAFKHVAAQLSEKGEPVLVGIREDKTEVRPQEMSEGTADQLYLALRLAAIQLHLKAHPPMPLILDDLLMTFDDERTQALLPILADLSTQTQVLVFSHHSHLENLFEKSISGKFQSHSL